MRSCWKIHGEHFTGNKKNRTKSKTKLRAADFPKYNIGTLFYLKIIQSLMFNSGTMFEERYWWNSWIEWSWMYLHSANWVWQAGKWCLQNKERIFEVQSSRLHGWPQKPRWMRLYLWDAPFLWTFNTGILLRLFWHSTIILNGL